MFFNWMNTTRLSRSFLSSFYLEVLGKNGAVYVQLDTHFCVCVCDKKQLLVSIYHD